MQWWVCALLAIALLLSGCFDDTIGFSSGSVSGPFGIAADPVQGPRFLGVVGGDYKSSVISLIDLASLADGDVQSQPARHSAVLHSGSQVGATSLALSGDVVWARTQLADHHLLAVDRNNAAILELDPRTGTVVRQVSVSTGFYSNPQDAIATSPTQWVVSRMNRNADTGPKTAAFARGDDVVALDPATGAFTARADLEAALPDGATGTLAAPQRLAATDRIFVPLAMFAPNFKGQATARLAVLRVSDLQVSHIADLAPARNCVNIEILSPTQLLLACQGSFQMAAEQASQSALLVVDVSGDTPHILKSIGIPSESGPWSRDIAALDAQWAVAVTLGNLQPKRSDRLWLVNLITGERRAMQDSGAPFGYSGLWADPLRRSVWLGEAQRKDGDLLRFLVTVAGQVVVGVPVAANPGGLGALELVGQ